MVQYNLQSLLHSLIPTIELVVAILYMKRAPYISSPWVPYISSLSSILSSTQELVAIMYMTWVPNISSPSSILSSSALELVAVL
jgi:hypothetical protein